MPCFISHNPYPGAYGQPPPPRSVRREDGPRPRCKGETTLSSLPSSAKIVPRQPVSLCRPHSKEAGGEVGDVTWSTGVSALSSCRGLSHFETVPLRRGLERRFCR